MDLVKGLTIFYSYSYFSSHNCDFGSILCFLAVLAFRRWISLWQLHSFWEFQLLHSEENIR